MAFVWFMVFLTVIPLVFADDQQLCNVKDVLLNGRVVSSQNLNSYAYMFNVPVFPISDVDPLCTFYLCPNGTQTFLLCAKKKPITSSSGSAPLPASSGIIVASSSSQGTFQPTAASRSLYDYSQSYSLTNAMPSTGIPVAVTAALNTYYLYGPKLPLSIKFSLCDGGNGPTTFTFDQFGPSSNKMLFGLANTLVTSLTVECLNPMFVTRSGLLEDLVNLKMLDIKFTQPTATDFTARNVLVLPSGAFAGAKSLESIRLDFQSSKVRLNSTVFDGLPKLQCLEMSGRNFDCTYCPLQDLLANSTFTRPDLNNGSYYANPYLPADIMSCGQYREAFCDGAFNRSIIFATRQECQTTNSSDPLLESSSPLNARMVPMMQPIINPFTSVFGAYPRVQGYPV
ncbi:hypothetical protein RvY_02405 [Ramazzottius varieornatus]|uniref:Uncharacterized protein n=1 Tax=Ramazzottius varieornatus TaxID=947166 RepID=A0A1D1UKD1_RAMVA|nr:hypothetical protein RvY_02405 [Ramazzottius varieornatus]